MSNGEKETHDLFVKKPDFGCLIDNNGDGSTWKHKKPVDKGYAMYGYNNSNAGDDYLVSPDLYFKKGNTYQISFNYKGANATYKEKLELVMGKEKTSESLSTVVQHYEFQSGELTSSGIITLPEVEESGVYHVAFHAISDKGMYNIYVADVEITEIPGSGGGSAGSRTLRYCPPDGRSATAAPM